MLLLNLLVMLLLLLLHRLQHLMQMFQSHQPLLGRHSAVNLCNHVLDGVYLIVFFVAATDIDEIARGVPCYDPY